MTLPEAIETTLCLFQKKPNADIKEIREDLMAAIIDTELASKLAGFIPVALCRLVFTAAGVQFSPHYVAIDDAGNETGEASFLEDPIYVEAYAYCTGLLANAEQAELYRLLAARSADYKAIMELHLRQGMVLNQLVIPPPQLNVPPSRASSSEATQKGRSEAEEDPHRNLPQMPVEAKAYMDTVKANFDRPFVKQFFYEVTLLEYNIPNQAASLFWTIQFRDKVKGAMVWTDSSGNWRIGKWIGLAGTEIPLQVDLGYFQDCPSAPTFQEALVVLESSQEQQAIEKRPWYKKLWKRPG